MKEYYECHVTMLGDKTQIQPNVESLGWIFSCIDNDICLGKGIKCYATYHYSVSKHSKEDVINYVEEVANALRSVGCNVIRTKVELVIYDSRSQECPLNKG